MARTQSLEVQMERILDEVNDKVKATVKTASIKTADEAVERLQAKSPQGATGDYAAGWTVSVKNGSYIVHNATEYRLTHLLENGHVSRNQFGTYGRVRARKHIRPVEQWAIKEFQRKIEEGLEQ